MLRLNFSKKKNGVPVLSRIQMDRMAELLLADYRPSAVWKPQTIDIDDFVQNYLGMRQDFQYLSHCGLYLGMTVFYNTDRVVVYNPEARRAEYLSVCAKTILIDSSLLEEGQEHRYRFTMGHEAAHGILHEAFFAAAEGRTNPDAPPVIRCRTSCSAARTRGLWSDYDWMEWQADAFSAALLMPRPAVCKAARDVCLKNPYLAANEEIRALEQAGAVSYLFSMSFEAAFRRLKDLGLVRRGLPLRKTGEVLGVFRQRTGPASGIWKGGGL